MSSRGETGDGSGPLSWRWAEPHARTEHPAAAKEALKFLSARAFSSRYAWACSDHHFCSSSRAYP